MGTHDIIIRQFGVLLTLADVAALFRTTPASLRGQIARGNNLGWALAAIQQRHDRRILFPAVSVAKIIDGEGR